MPPVGRFLNPKQARAHYTSDSHFTAEKAFTQPAPARDNTPRKRLGYRTPAEIFTEQVLRLNGESTFPLARE